MISVRFQGKPFSITVIQVYMFTTNAKEAEVEWFYNDLQELPELIPKKKEKRMAESLTEGRFEGRNFDGACSA